MTRLGCQVTTSQIWWRIISSMFSCEFAVASRCNEAISVDLQAVATRSWSTTRSTFKSKRIHLTFQDGKFTLQRGEFLAGIGAFALATGKADAELRPHDPLALRLGLLFEC